MKKITNLNSVPNVIKQNPNGERAYDIFSCLLEDRIIMLDGQVDDTMASLIRAQLLYLQAQDSEAEISIYINSPGGSVSAGLGIIDTMNAIKPDVRTVATGLAASMGALILTCGTKGKRQATVNSEVMIHQPLGGAQGQATDIIISAKHIEKTRDRLNNMIANATGKTIEEVAKDTERDNFMYADEAVAYGLIDSIVEPNK